MITDFAQRFDSYFAASCDLRDYMQAKGYWEDGDRIFWEPQDPADLEVGEWDCEEFYQDNDEPTLGFEETDEF